MEEDAKKHGKDAVSCHPKTWPEGIAMEEDAQKRGKVLSCRPSTEEDEDEEHKPGKCESKGVLHSV
jgi:hypothetical protein